MHTLISIFWCVFKVALIFRIFYIVLKNPNSRFARFIMYVVLLISIVGIGVSVAAVIGIAIAATQHHAWLGIGTYVLFALWGFCGLAFVWVSRRLFRTIRH